MWTQKSFKYNTHLVKRPLRLLSLLFTKVNDVRCLNTSRSTGVKRGKNGY